MYQQPKIYIQVGITKRQVVKIAAVGTVTVMFTSAATKLVCAEIVPRINRLNRKLAEETLREN